MNPTYTVKLPEGTFETWTVKPDFSFIHATQVHGTDIVTQENLPCEADGLVTSWENFTSPLAIKTADCLPIVIEGEKGTVFLHAGWRGLAHGILEKPEIHMIKPKSAYIGPSIHKCCFEVSPDFAGNFPQSSNLMEREGKCYFDLQTEAKMRLLSKFPELKVDVSPVCTHCDQKLHSYRRDKTTNRNWNILRKG